MSNTTQSVTCATTSAACAGIGGAPAGRRTLERDGQTNAPRVQQRRESDQKHHGERRDCRERENALVHE